MAININEYILLLVQSLPIVTDFDGDFDDDFNDDLTIFYSILYKHYIFL
jgi:hypothetical protein